MINYLVTSMRLLYEPLNLLSYYPYQFGIAVVKFKFVTIHEACFRLMSTGRGLSTTCV